MTKENIFQFQVTHKESQRSYLRSSWLTVPSSSMWYELPSFQNPAALCVSFRIDQAKYWKSVNTTRFEGQEGARTEISHLNETVIPFSFGFISFS